jgi:hypothetical protein
MSFNFEGLVTAPVYKIVAIVLVFAVYVALVPTLVTSITSYCAMAGLGVFGTILGIILPLLLGVVLLIIGIKMIMGLAKGM